MSYKVVVPKPISQKIGDFQLSRELTNRLLAAIHEDVPHDYEQSRRQRIPDFEWTYKYRIVLTDEGLTHVFRFAVDDSTAQGHLILVSIHHETRGKS
jgi:hypothetical protein